MSCSVTVQGTLTACSVVSEDPDGLGFGDALIRMSKTFKMRPKQTDGRPVEGGKVTDTKIGVVQVWQKQGGQWKLLARQGYKLA